MKNSILMAALIMLSLSLSAQKPAETRLFNKVISSGTLKDYDKFLSKYPASTYTPVILGKKDTLLRVSPYSTAEAKEIADRYIEDLGGFIAFGWRDEGTDKLIVFRLQEKKTTLNEITITDLVKNGGNWKKDSSATYPCADEVDKFTTRTFLDELEKIKLNEETFFHFTIKYSADDGTSMLVPVLYNPKTQILTNIAVNCFKPRNGKTECIITSKGNSVEENWLSDSVLKQPGLEIIPDEEIKTLEAIKLWGEQNPAALTNAGKISAVILPKDCSLSKIFIDKKRKESSSLYKAAMFDYREYTVIVVQETKTGNFVLEWVEPCCTDSNTQRLLNSICFRNNYTIEMFYYKGNRTFKYFLNLSSKTLKR